MSDKTGIEWTDATWNPIRGCTRVSEGCRNCYAERVAARFNGPGQPYEGLAERTAKGPRWTGALSLVEKALDQPMRWRKPRRIFVNSMSDLFHESVPNEWIGRVFAVMALAPQHVFQVLTKRPERAREWFDTAGVAFRVASHAKEIAPRTAAMWGLANAIGWHLPNVWLGVSVEDQPTADARIPDLLATPAARRFVSAEPLLDAVDLCNLRRYNPRGEPWVNALRGLVTRGAYLARNPGECSFATSTQVIPPELPRLDWVIAGGESGSGARPMADEWAYMLRDQCRAAGVAFFMKQMAKKAPIPADLMVREFPDAR